MATIDPRIFGNPQLTGILTSVPMPQVVTNGVSPFAMTGAGGAYTSFSPTYALGTGFNAFAPAVVMPNAATGTGQIVVGSGSNYTAPTNGAQPQAPTAATQPASTGAVTPGVAGVAAGTGATTGAASGAAATSGATAGATNVSTPIITTTASGAAPSTGSALAKAESGFGAANRAEPIRASVDGASFGFPSFRASNKSDDAPGINWGPGWTRVEKDGLWYMQHSNGVRAVPAVEWRITPKPADKVQTIKVANGWGKRFPDGSVLVFDRTEGAYLLDPKGNKKPMAKGNHVIGGVKVRIFEATVVRTIDKDGKVDVFDSRGNRSTGTTRWNEAATVGSANAGAASIVAGGGAASTASAPGKVDAGGPPGKVTGGGAAGVASDIQAATDLARQILGEIQGGSVDPARLQALVAQLNTLPSGLLQAMGAGGSMTGNGTTTAVGGVNGPAAGSQPAGSTTAGGGATTPATTTTTSTPTPGRDANATTKQLEAGASAKADAAAIPAELHGKQARFGQLPDAVQQAVAKAFGSDQGSRAFTPDRLIAFAADGTVKVVDAGPVNIRHQAQVRGAGPGEDQVMTMRPGRQPKFGASSTKPVSGGGANATGVHASGGSHAVSGGGGIAAKKITLFAAGSETRHEDFGGLDGTYTFATLPAKARAALISLLRSGDDAAAKAFGSRTGSGWVIDPNATIVLGAGYATFPNGLTMARGAAAATSRPPVGIPTVTVTTTPSTARPTNQPEAHDATRPPVAGGGAGASGGGGATPPSGGTTGGSPGNAPRPPMVMEPGMVHDHG